MPQLGRLLVPRNGAVADQGAGVPRRGRRAGVRRHRGCPTPAVGDPAAGSHRAAAVPMRACRRQGLHPWVWARRRHLRTHTWTRPVVRLLSARRPRESRRQPPCWSGPGTGRLRQRVFHRASAHQLQAGRLREASAAGAIGRLRRVAHRRVASRQHLVARPRRRGRRRQVERRRATSHRRRVERLHGAPELAVHHRQRDCRPGTSRRHQGRRRQGWVRRGSCPRDTRGGCRQLVRLLATSHHRPARHLRHTSRVARQQCVPSRRRACRRAASRQPLGARPRVVPARRGGRPQGPARDGWGDLRRRQGCHRGKSHPHRHSHRRRASSLQPWRREGHRRARSRRGRALLGALATCG